MKVALATVSSDVVPAGSQKKSTLRNLLRRRLAAKNNANAIIATIQNQGEKKLSKRPPARAARPVAFSLFMTRKVDHRTGTHTATNKAARALIVPLRKFRRVMGEIIKPESTYFLPPGHVPRLSSR